MGDYYAWYCEWCDSRNLTLWTRIEKGQVCCGVCHTVFPESGQSSAEQGQPLSRVI